MRPRKDRADLLIEYLNKPANVVRNKKYIRIIELLYQYAGKKSAVTHKQIPPTIIQDIIDELGKKTGPLSAQEENLRRILDAKYVELRGAFPIPETLIAGGKRRSTRRRRSKATKKRRSK